jgi:hypothetical protein
MWRLITGIAAWRDCGTLRCLHGRLRDKARTAAGRDPDPTAAVIDFQSIKAVVPCRRPAGPGTRQEGRRASGTSPLARSIGLVLVITAASVQDRDGARPLLWNLSHCCTRDRLA